jgi:hypothetical protein
MTPLISMLAGARAFGFGLFRGQSYTPEGSAYEIAKYVVPTGDIASVTFSIPSDYRHIRFEISCQNSSSSNSSGWLVGNFNNDTTSSYSYHILSGSGSSASSSGGLTSAPIFGDINNNGSGSSIFAPSVIDLVDYNSRSKYKTFKVLTGFDNNSWGEMYSVTGNWRSLEPITSVKFYVSGYNIKANSTFTLIGYK